MISFWYLLDASLPMGSKLAQKLRMSMYISVYGF
jgi:hypothetical protein